MPQPHTDLSSRSAQAVFLLASRHAEKRAEKRRADRERIHNRVVHPIDTPRLTRDPLQRRESRLISTITTARLLVAATVIHVLVVFLLFFINQLIGQHAKYRPPDRLKVRIVQKSPAPVAPPPVEPLMALKGPVQPDFAPEKPKPKETRRKRPKRSRPASEEVPQAFEGLPDPVVGLNLESTVRSNDGPSFGVGTSRMGKTGQRAAGPERSSGESGAGGPSGSGDLPERRRKSPQLSLWIDPPQLLQMVLIRPVITLLMSVPGYSTMLRGSGIDPFIDFRRLRIRLTAPAPNRLVLAGTHDGGERALLDAAHRVAAMRKRQPVWRGGADLRATSWVDGSGVDRGFAVHQDAFLIAPRSAMPTLLGTEAPAARIMRMSWIQSPVVLRLTVEDARRFLPGLDRCALQALSLSVSAGAGGAPRAALISHYESASSANQSRACLRALPAGGAQLSLLVEWLATSRGRPDSYSRKLKKRVTRDQFRQLIEELAWAFRAAGRQGSSAHP